MDTTALITGASKRIGKAIAEYLAQNGWNVIIHFNVSEKPAEELTSFLKTKYPNQFFHSVKSNLADEKDVEILIPKLVAEFGRFHLLVNNASVFNPGYLKETLIELFDNQLNVNLKAPFILMRDFANQCEQGNIINIVDTRITTNKSNFAAYSLSKKGLWELTKMAALEFAPEIRVNAIAPGVTLPPDDKDENYLAELVENIPMSLPTAMIDQEIESLMKPYYENAKKQNRDVNELKLPKENFEDQAKRRVALGLILGEIIRKNDIKAEADKIRAVIDDMAQSYEKPEDVVSWYYGDEKRLAEVEQMVLEDATVDWVLGKVSVTEENMPFADVMEPATQQ